MRLRGPAGKAVFSFLAGRELSHSAVNAVDKAASVHFDEPIFYKPEVAALAR